MHRIRRHSTGKSTWSSRAIRGRRIIVWMHWYDHKGEALVNDSCFPYKNTWP